MVSGARCECQSRTFQPLQVLQEAVKRNILPGQPLSNPAREGRPRWLRFYLSLGPLAASLALSITCATASLILPVL